MLWFASRCPCVETLIVSVAMLRGGRPFKKQGQWNILTSERTSLSINGQSLYRSLAFCPAIWSLPPISTTWCDAIPFHHSVFCLGYFIIVTGNRLRERQTLMGNEQGRDIPWIMNSSFVQFSLLGFCFNFWGIMIIFYLCCNENMIHKISLSSKWRKN